ncbi:hypothetical protein RYX36_021920 [Vicia faba]
MTASIMLLHSMAQELIPQPIHDYLFNAFRYLMKPCSPTLTLIIEESTGIRLEHQLNNTIHQLPIVIRANHTQAVLGEKGTRIRELTFVVRKWFKFPNNSVKLYAEKVNYRGLCAIAQAESLCYKLLGGLAVPRACYGILRFVMEVMMLSCSIEGKSDENEEIEE